MSANATQVYAAYVGHNRETNRQLEVGDLTTKWMDQYGTVWRLKGCMGVSSGVRVRAARVDC